jgi:hypothetical protein
MLGYDPEDASFVELVDRADARQSSFRAPHNDRLISRERRSCALEYDHHGDLLLDLSMRRTTRAERQESEGALGSAFLLCS